MSPAKPPSDVPKFGQIDPDKGLDKPNQNKPDTKAFESYMQEDNPQAEKSGQISPMDLAQKQQSSITPTFDSILDQTNNSQNQINDIKNKLNTPNLSLKNSWYSFALTRLIIIKPLFFLNDVFWMNFKSTFRTSIYFFRFSKRFFVHISFTFWTPYFFIFQLLIGLFIHTWTLFIVQRLYHFRATSCV
jgi:hypothetical protein